MFKVIKKKWVCLLPWALTRLASFTEHSLLHLLALPPEIEEGTSSVPIAKAGMDLSGLPGCRPAKESDSQLVPSQKVFTVPVRAAMLQYQRQHVVLLVTSTHIWTLCFPLTNGHVLDKFFRRVALLYRTWYSGSFVCFLFRYYSLSFCLCLLCVIKCPIRFVLSYFHCAISRVLFSILLWNNGKIPIEIWFNLKFV